LSALTHRWHCPFFKDHFPEINSTKFGCWNSIRDNFPKPNFGWDNFVVYAITSILSIAFCKFKKPFGGLLWPICKCCMSCSTSYNKNISKVVKVFFSSTKCTRSDIRSKLSSLYILYGSLISIVRL
jgi:hypothetical protein